MSPKMSTSFNYPSDYIDETLCSAAEVKQEGGRTAEAVVFICKHTSLQSSPPALSVAYHWKTVIVCLLL